MLIQEQYFILVEIIFFTNNKWYIDNLNQKKDYFWEKF